MKLIEAKQRLEKMKSGVSIFTANKEQLNNDTALMIGTNAISRLMPQKPERTELDDDSFEIIELFACPQCGETIKEPYKKTPFCNNPKCGQAFDWK